MYWLITYFNRIYFFPLNFRFVLHAIVRPLTVGLLQLTSDYFFKPLLAVLFNGVIQPPLIFLYNVATSLRDLCDPIAEGLGYFFREIAVLCRSIRLFEVKREREVVMCNKNDTEHYVREKDQDGRRNKATQCSVRGSNAGDFMTFEWIILKKCYICILYWSFKGLSTIYRLKQIPATAVFECFLRFSLKGVLDRKIIFLDKEIGEIKAYGGKVHEEVSICKQGHKNTMFNIRWFIIFTFQQMLSDYNFTVFYSNQQTKIIS